MIMRVVTAVAACSCAVGMSPQLRLPVVALDRGTCSRSRDLNDYESCSRWQEIIMRDLFLFAIVSWGLLEGSGEGGGQEVQTSMPQWRHHRKSSQICIRFVSVKADLCQYN